MSSQHEISEYINNLPLQKTLCKGFRPDDVYEVICNISSMYNKILSEAYEENDELQRKLENIKTGDADTDHKVPVKEETVVFMEKKSDIFEKEEKKEEDDSNKEIIIAEEKREEAMTDKELQRLKRGELLEILLEQSKENESLKSQIEEKDKVISGLKEKLESREIELEEAGTIAEASFKLNGVFDAAEKAAQQYLDNLKALHDRETLLYEKKEAEVENRCAALMQATQERCDFMKEESIKKCESMETEVKQKCDELLVSTENRCQEREKAAEEKCVALDLQAKINVDNRWNELSKRLEDFYTAHEGLKELLATSKMI